MKRNWPEYSLALIEVDGGLQVRQADDAYLARDWRLTDSVLHVIEVAQRYGLVCMIQNRHPQASKREPFGDGAIYLSFSRSAHEYWVLGLNDNAGSTSSSRSDVIRVLFNKNFRHALIQANVPFQVEKFRNASNIEVPVEYVENATKACIPYLDFNAQQRGKSGVPGQYPGFRDETDIERWLMEYLTSNLIDRKISVLGRQVRIDVGIIDILLRDEEVQGLIVVEVKQGRAQPVHVEKQLARYLTSPYLASIAKGGPITGCLVAELIESTTKDAIERIGSGLVAYSITWHSSSNVTMRRVAGRWPSSPSLA